MVQSAVLGFPRIGPNRELKKATEGYWNGKITVDELFKVGKDLRTQNWKLQKEAGVDIIPSNDFSFYDQVLDLFCCSMSFQTVTLSTIYLQSTLCLLWVEVYKERPLKLKRLSTSLLWKWLNGSTLTTITLDQLSPRPLNLS